MTAMREKLHAHIDTLPEEWLKVLTPIVELIAEDYYWKPGAETDLTDEEFALIDEAMEERRRDPSSFTPWKKVRRG